VTAIDDPVFGKLEYNNGWIGEVFVPFLETTFELTISNSLDHPPGDAERNMWQTFLEQQARLKDSVTRALAEYYTRYLEAWGWGLNAEEQAEFAPPLYNSEDIWTLVTPGSWLLLEYERDKERPSLTIDFNARWDVEHGVSVTFYREQMSIAQDLAHWSDQDQYDLDGKRLETTP
jgi:hypothetical protein